MPYTVTPGDLYSYTPDGINARMAALGAGRTTRRYVIEPNAYTFPDGSTFLSASWADGAITQPSFQAMKDTFTESSWTLDGSFYVGFSGGEGVNVFGMGWDLSSSSGVPIPTRRRAPPQTRTTGGSR